MFQYNESCFILTLFIAERVGVDVVECACVIEIADLKVWVHLQVANLCP